MIEQRQAIDIQPELQSGEPLAHVEGGRADEHREQGHPIHENHCSDQDGKAFAQIGVPPDSEPLLDGTDHGGNKGGSAEGQPNAMDDGVGEKLSTAVQPHFGIPWDLLIERIAQMAKEGWHRFGAAGIGPIREFLKEDLGSEPILSTLLGILDGPASHLRLGLCKPDGLR